MSNFIPVALYDVISHAFIGYAIKGEHKLQSTNIWGESEETELNARLAELNASADLRQYWPHPKDPGVQALLNDPEFHPIKETTVASNANIMDRIRAACEEVAKQRAGRLA